LRNLSELDRPTRTSNISTDEPPHLQVKTIILTSVVIGNGKIDPSGWPVHDNKLGFIDKHRKIVIKPQF
jgi:hypothetical protein